MMDFLKTHPEATEIIKLAEILDDGGFGFYFNLEDDIQSGEDIFDNEYEYMIEMQTGELIGSRAPITVFQRSDGLEVLDMRPARGKEFPADSEGELHCGLSAAQAMEIIEKFFKTA